MLFNTQLFLKCKVLQGGGRGKAPIKLEKTFSVLENLQFNSLQAKGSPLLL